MICIEIVCCHDMAIGIENDRMRLGYVKNRMNGNSVFDMFDEENYQT